MADEKNERYSDIIVEVDGKKLFVMSFDQHNDDWIKSVNNSREKEIKIHEELARKYREKQEKKKKKNKK